MLPAAPSPAEDPEGWLRRVLWAVALAVYAGAAVELALAEHWAEWRQWIAFVAVGAAGASVVAAWRAPSPATLGVARGLSAGVLVVSVLGVGLHLWGNYGFSLEVAPGDDAWERTWDTLKGGNPAFAPGMLAVAAVLGLAAAWRHPAAEPERQPGATGA